MSSKNKVDELIGQPAPMIMLKQISALDDGCRTVLARCPVAAFGYRDADGTSRTTFIGGAPGFVRVHSPTRISFPSGATAYGPVSFFFLLPGVGEVLRVNGTIAASRGAQTAVDITEAYVHCAQAVLRSGLWQPPAAAEPAAETPNDGPLSAPGVADFLASARFLALSTWDDADGSDTSPRGDQQAVARILDGRTLVMPDRRGNKRADSLRNLLQDDRFALAALVPGRSGVLHLRGRAEITDDPALLATMALRGVPPHAALLLHVEHAELAGNDAVARSRMWSPDVHLARGDAPDLMAIAGKHLAGRSRGAWPLRVIGAIPGFSRLLRLVMNRAYRSGLLKEGYEPIAADPRPRPAGEIKTDFPVRAVRVTEVRRETPQALTLVLEDAGDAPKPFDFRPGQFFTLVADIEGRPVRRAYSASSAPGSPRLEVTVKQVEGGRFSTHVHESFRVGDHLAVRGPSGSFHLRSEPPEEIVLIAAGSGITPMMSMIRAGRGRAALLYTSRTEDEIIFAGELTRLAAESPERLSVTHVLTRRDGRLDADGVKTWVAALSPAANAHYFVCGPEQLMDTVQSVLAGLGVPDEQVHTERFASGADAETATTVPQEMTVEENGRTLRTVVVEPGQTLLDAGLAAGLPMPHSCTVGSCGDCMVRLRAGEVTQATPNCLTPQQQADGYVLACVGCPRSRVTLDIAGV